MVGEIRFRDIQPGDRIRGKDGRARVVSAVSVRREQRRDIVSLYEMGGTMILCGEAGAFLFLLCRPRPGDTALGDPLAEN